MLKNEGKKIFNEFKSYLERHSTFELSDELNLTELAMYFQIFYEASRKLSKEGLIIVYPNKLFGINPYLKIIISASKQIRGLSLKLGIYDVLKDKMRQYGKITKVSEKYLK